MVVHPSMSQAHQSQVKEHPSERRVHHWIWILKKKEMIMRTTQIKGFVLNKKMNFFFNNSVMFFHYLCLSSTLAFRSLCKKNGHQFQDQ